MSIKSNDKILRSNTTLMANIEFTSNCNLKCTYCPVSQPEYKGYTLQENLIPLVFQKLINRQVKTVGLNGHGETTMLKNWVESCKPLFGKVNNIQIISNFSKLFNQEEIESLAKFSHLYISIDTSDPQLLSKIRRKVDIGIVIQNICNIRAESIELGINPPKFIFSTGIYDKNVFKLAQFAYWTAALKIDAIQFWNFLKHPDIDQGVNIYPLSSLSNEEQKIALQVIDKALAILKNNNIDYTMAGDFVETFRKQVESIKLNTNTITSNSKAEKINIDDSRVKKAIAGNRSTNNINHQRGLIEKVPPGMTRNCFDPWFYTQIRATGEVLPCCVHSSIGNLVESDDLDLILNNPKIIELRNRLLTGNLDRECSMCVNKSTLAVEEFQQKLEHKFEEIEEIEENHQPTEEKNVYSKVRAKIIPQRINNLLLKINLKLRKIYCK